MKKILFSVADRLKESSSWAGFAGIAAGAGVATPAYTAVTGAIAGFCGLVAFALKEKGAS